MVALESRDTDHVEASMKEASPREFHPMLKLYPAMWGSATWRLALSRKIGSASKDPVVVHYTMNGDGIQISEHVLFSNRLI